MKSYAQTHFQASYNQNNNQNSNYRNRLKSLKILKRIQPTFDQQYGQNQARKIMDILEKKLARDTRKETQPVAELPQVTNRQNQHGQTHQNKLYLFFIKNISEANDKVQRQKLNYWQKEFNFMKAQINKKTGLNKTRQKQGEKSIQKKLKQLHQLFQQTKSLIAKQKALKSIKIDQDQLQPQSLQSILQKKQIIRQNMNDLKRQAKQIEEEVQKIKIVDLQIITEWKGFLKLVLKNNFYFLDGVKKILKQLKRFNVTLIIEDLPDILDQFSKKYLLKVYINSKIVSEEDLQHRSPSFDPRKRVKSNIQTSSLLKKGKLKQIYTQTKDLVTCLLKDSKWKKLDNNRQQLDKKPQIKLPQINYRNNINVGSSTTKENEQSKIKYDKRTGLFLNNVKGEESQQNDEKIQLQRIYTIYGQGSQAFMIKRLLFGLKR